MLNTNFVVKAVSTKSDYPSWLYYIEDNLYPGGFHSSFKNATRYTSYGDAEKIIFENCIVGQSYAIDKVYEVGPPIVDTIKTEM